MRTLANSHDYDRLSARLNGVVPSDVAIWGRMTVHQMLCHLADSFSLALGQRAASPASGFLQRTVVKCLALYAPIRWPRNLPTRPELEQGRGGTAPVDFERDRLHALSVMQQFAGEPSLARNAHPIFGNMSHNDWLRWGYLHTDHHLRQFGR